MSRIAKSKKHKVDRWLPRAGEVWGEIGVSANGGRLSVWGDENVKSIVVMSAQPVNILKITKLHNWNALFVWYVNHSLNKSLLIKRAAAGKWAIGVRADLHASCSWLELFFPAFPESEFCLCFISFQETLMKSPKI